MGEEAPIISDLKSKGVTVPYIVLGVIWTIFVALGTYAYDAGKYVTQFESMQAKINELQSQVRETNLHLESTDKTLNVISNKVDLHSYQIEDAIRQLREMKGR